MSDAAPETLLTPEKFEAALRSALADEELQGEEASELREAFERLRADPSLLVGGAVGGFTYSDPLLEQAVQAMRLYVEGEPRVLKAGLPGSELTNRPTAWAKWLRVSVKAFVHRNDPSFQQLATRIPAAPVLLDHPVVRLAVLGDAGLQGVAQERVLQMILDRHQEKPFHAVIHLGDVYFAGGPSEMLKHFLKPFSKLRAAGMKLFTLLGNHDLYGGGASFEYAMAALEQPGRYFAIETPHWRIACLDTSLFDQSISRKHGRLDDVQLQWLQDSIRSKGDRGVIVMSHHYYISGWKPNSDPTLRLQLRDPLRNALAWYWGHEHNCATYDCRETDGFYGACVGNGSFNERWSNPPQATSGVPSWYTQGKCSCYSDTAHNWPHGFLELQLEQGVIEEFYYLENSVEKPHRRTLRP